MLLSVDIPESCSEGALDAASNVLSCKDADVISDPSSPPTENQADMYKHIITDQHH